MSALSSLIIVLVLRGDKKGRDWFSFERIWKKTQSRKPFRLAHGSSTLSPHTDAAFGCCDQSLPPDGGLHPHALRSCYSFEPPALAYRSRFGVARQIIS